jgi:peptidoglycan hydrolase CwlO-like protein
MIKYKERLENIEKELLSWEEKMKKLNLKRDDIPNRMHKNIVRQRIEYLRREIKKYKKYIENEYK